MVKQNVLNKIWILKFVSDNNGLELDIDSFQTLVFNIQKQFENKNIRSLEYEFIYWLNGPYSKELQEDLDFLINKDYIKQKKVNIFELTKPGEKVVEKFQDLYSEENINNSIKLTFESFKSVLNKYTNNNLHEYKFGDVC